MHLRSFAPLAAALLAACASNSASVGAGAQPPPAQREAAAAERRFPNPVTMLIGARDSLQLDDLQVETLHQIEADLRDQNAPLYRQLPQGGEGARGPGGGRGGMRGMDGGGMGGGMRGGGGGPPGGGPPGGGRQGGGTAPSEIFRQIRENDQNALARAYQVMSEEQAAHARAWIEAHMARRRQPGSADD